MSKVDLILLHAPSVYDFRQRNAIYGPVSDAVPSTPIFEMYPIGFMTLAGRLLKEGFSVRIVNIAVKMLQNKCFDVERYISLLHPVAFGIDLHWLVHVQGSLELARIVKKYHPKIPVIFGGLTASYYHEELISYPHVDYVIRGDSAEVPLVGLLNALKGRGSFYEIPNLTWKDNSERVWINELSYMPESLDELIFEYRTIVKCVCKYRDLSGHLPFKNWLSYPITAVLPVRGCVNDCVVCGGSASGFRRSGRQNPAYRSPELLAKDICNIASFSGAPIMVLGDIRQGRDGYADKFLGALRRRKINNHLAFEMFSPCTKEFLKSISQTVANFNLLISPESHDEKVRRAFGKSYGNDELEDTIQNALEMGCNRIDLFFMIGIPRQTSESVKETIKYCEHILKNYRKKVHIFISPLAPFLDPGSRVFEDPERYGFRLFYRTLEEHRKAMLLPSWKYILNYQTEWMSRDEIVASTYEACLKLNSLKKEYGLIESRAAQRVESDIYKNIESINEIDKLVDNGVGTDYNLSLLSLAELVNGTTCEKEEMSWPSGRGLRIHKIIKELIRGGI